MFIDTFNPNDDTLKSLILLRTGEVVYPSSSQAQVDQRAVHCNDAILKAIVSKHLLWTVGLKA